MALRDDQKERYSRHLVIRQVGKSGQEKILNSKVLMVGAGGLGSVCSLYLVTAGVGELAIVDADTVKLSDLQRQILYSTNDLEKIKVDCAKHRLSAINKDTNIAIHNLRLDSKNAKELIKNYDVIIDCSDNYDTRYLINDACVLTGKPLVHGAVLMFDGQATTIIPGKSPCFRCVFPQAPDSSSVPSPKDAGVWSIAPGIIGVIQANEALKLILGIGELLTAKLLTFNALKYSFKQLNLSKDSNCPVCTKSGS